MKRVQLDFNEEFFEELELLQKETNFSTRKELFDNAFTLFQWALDEVKKGNKVGSFNDGEDDFTEIMMPVFNKIKRKSSKLSLV